MGVITPLTSPLESPAVFGGFVNEGPCSSVLSYYLIMHMRNVSHQKFFKKKKILKNFKFFTFFFFLENPSPFLVCDWNSYKSIAFPTLFLILFSLFSLHIRFSVFEFKPEEILFFFFTEVPNKSKFLAPTRVAAWEVIRENPQWEGVLP